MKLSLIITLSAALGLLMCYGAMKTAERIAAKQQTQIEAIP